VVTVDRPHTLAVPVPVTGPGVREAVNEMAEVALDKLTKVFPGGTVAVDSLTMTATDGEFVVLVGPSGCGKSTALRMVAGLEDATSGTVSIGGRVVNDLPPKARDIAMVFQNYALYPHMTVAQNIGFSLRLAKLPKAQVRRMVDEVADVLGLIPLLARKPAALSGGQRQRVAMGRALVRRPQVFLMDEPLSNLDAKLRVAMRGELSRLHALYRTTTLYVTHDQVEAMTLGNRIAVLERGRLQQIGTPEELYFAPVNMFVAGFMGSPAMNFARARLLPAEPVAGGIGAVLEVAGLRWPLSEGYLSARPGLRRYAGREVVIGIRPTDLGLARQDDAPQRPDRPTIRITTTTVESLGNEKHVLFTPPVQTVRQPDLVTASAHEPADPLAEGLTDVWTARVAPLAAITAGTELDLAVELAGAYFFDPDTEAAIAQTAPATGAIPPAVLTPVELTAA
jgi:multiple sugar transport system ATP-binding protein